MEAKIYSINNCSYCDAAKNLLKSRNIEFEEINLTNDDDGKFDLIKKTGQRTFPQVFFGEKFIGGYTDLKSFLDSKGS